MPDNIEQLEKKIRMLQEDFEDFSFSVNKKIGSTGSREVQAKIKNGSTVLIGSSNSAFRADQNGIYLGNATFASAPFRVTMAGALTATSATITGAITATSGDIGGWVVAAGYLYNLQSGTPTSTPSDGLVLASGNEGIIVYENTEKRTEMGYLSAGVYGFKAYDDDGTTPVFEISDTQKMIGGWIFENDNLYKLASGTPGSSPSNGLVLDGSATPVITAYENTEKRLEVGYLSAGVYGIKGYDDDGTTVLFELSDTQKALNGSILSSDTVAGLALKIGNQSWSHDLVFSSTDLDTVAWASGTITMADGSTTYSITGANTGNMAARTYVYLDIAISTTVLQTTTTASTAVGDGKVLIAVAENSTTEATFQVFGGIGGVAITGGDIENLSITAAQITANTITANEIAANTITGTQILTMSISGKSCIFDTGTIAGWTMSATTLASSTNIVLDASNKAISINDAIFGNSGIQLQYNSGTPRMYVGDGANQHLNFDGTNLTVNNSPIGFQNIVGDGNDGDVTISTNTALTRDMFYDSLIVNSGAVLNTAGYRIFAKTKITVTANSYIQRTPNNGGNGTNAGAYTSPGTGGAAGAALAAGSLGGALAGVAGKNGVNGVRVVSAIPILAGNAGTAGDAGTNSAKSLVSSDGIAGIAGGAGGDANVGGAQSGGAGGAAGAAGTRTGTVYNQIRSALAAYIMRDFIDAGNLTGSPSNGGSGSGGSGAACINSGYSGGYHSGATGGSGGSGSCGGIGVIFAKEIQVDSGSYIRCEGGAGGNAGTSGDYETEGTPNAPNVAVGGSGGSGAGDGGNGGVLILVYSKLTNNGTISVASGAGGTGAAGRTKYELGSGVASDGVAGANGTAGNAGRLIQLVV